MDNGDVKEYKGQKWVAHCGIWWSQVAFGDVDHQHRRARGIECPECGYFLVTKADRARTIEVERAGSFENKLRGDEAGEHHQFLMDGGLVPAISPGQSLSLCLHRVYDPFLATHLACVLIPDLVGQISIVSLMIGRYPIIVGPLAADHFAVRLPEDTQVPIDRGAALPKPVLVYPGGYYELSVQWDGALVTGGPRVLRFALFGLPLEREAGSPKTK